MRLSARLSKGVPELVQLLVPEELPEELLEVDAAPRGRLTATKRKEPDR